MSSNTKLPIQPFRVVKIIDDEKIVINAGSNIGVRIGDKFQIYEIGENLIDPETHEDLGTLDTIKDTVEAINVFPKMCICSHREVVSSFSGLVPKLAKEQNATLKVNVAEISGGLSEDKIIKIGDKAKKITIHKSSET